MNKLKFTGNPAQIRWSKYVEEVFSYCDALLPEHSCPLRLFQSNGELGAAFCDRCAHNLFGMSFFDTDQRESQS